MKNCLPCCHYIFYKTRVTLRLNTHGQSAKLKLETNPFKCCLVFFMKTLSEWSKYMRKSQIKVISDTKFEKNSCFTTLESSLRIDYRVITRVRSAKGQQKNLNFPSSSTRKKSNQFRVKINSKSILLKSNRDHLEIIFSKFLRMCINSN